MKLLLLLFLLQISLSASSKQTFQITFSSKSADPYAKTKIQQHNVRNFTLCFWFSQPTVTSNTWTTLVSYNPITIASIKPTEYASEDVQTPLIYVIYQTNEGIDKSGSALDDWREWVHMCLTLESFPNRIRTIKRFVNSRFRESMKRQDDAIYPDRELFLGKRVIKSAEEKLQIEPFKGHISEVNLWNYVLPDKEIERLYNNCTYGGGNVVEWDLKEWEIRGGAEVSPVHLPCMGVEEKKSPKGNSSSYISIRGSLLEGFLFLVFMWIL